MRELFNKAMVEKLQSAYYAVNEIQKQVSHSLIIPIPSSYLTNIHDSCNAVATWDRASTPATYRLRVVPM